MDVDFPREIHDAIGDGAIMENGMKLVLLLAQVMTLVSALVVVLHPNILYATIFLLFSFLGVAVMFVFAGADFLAGAQVIVYVGGVTILVLFAIMLTQWLYEAKLKTTLMKGLIPFIVVMGALGPILIKETLKLSDSVSATPPEKMGEFAALAKTQLIGQALLGNYLLPFEAITILLLGALVGAVWLARPE